PATHRQVRLVESLVKDPSKEAYYVVECQAMYPDRIRVQWRPDVDPEAKLAVLETCKCRSLGMAPATETSHFEVLQIEIDTADPYPVAKRWLLEHPQQVDRVCPVFW
ncbi:MAG TPA: hypothetical protein PLV25_07820, partial [Opitutales bacterium]|nr:hypothetical protein [Opitutales bacterium]